MTATSMSRIVVPSLALVAACGAALVFGTAHLRRAPPVKTNAATAEPTFSQPASGARDEGSAAPAPAQAEANAVAAELAVSPRSPVTDESVPAFDIARIERTGDAVIAGRAAPGAIVELLRNGELHDRAVADQSGQFVMVPPRLPPGDYELTLRSRQPDGKQATSKQSVVVALAEVESSSGAVRPDLCPSYESALKSGRQFQRLHAQRRQTFPSIVRPAVFDRHVADLDNIRHDSVTR